MSELFIVEEDWKPFDNERGSILSARIKKHEDSRVTKHLSVIIWSITNPDHEHYGKFFIVEPGRTKSIFERLKEATYDSIEDAKEDAETMYREYLEKIRSGTINWWTRKEKNEHGMVVNET